MKRHEVEAILVEFADEWERVVASRSGPAIWETLQVHVDRILALGEAE